MLIECLRKRPNGTTVTLNGQDYHFKPDEQNRHVSEVEDKDHIKTLLGIAAYQIAGDDEAPQTEADDLDSDDEEDRDEEDNGDSDTGADEEDQTSGDDADDLDSDDEEATLENMDMSELIEEHVAVFGKAPHPAAGEETLRAKLIEKRDEETE